MKKIVLFLNLILIVGILFGCTAVHDNVDIVATTLPVFEFATRLCEGTDITVGRLVTEEVSCLHDYTLQVSQMRKVESADAVVISGAGLEDFLEDVLDTSKTVIDASEGVHVHTGEHHHDHAEHSHESDPHIWLSPENAEIMVKNICTGLTELYPLYEAVFSANAADLLLELGQLHAYGEQMLSNLSCRELVTFHDGFSYFAESFDLSIVKAVEEESGSEASAAELIELIEIVKGHNLPAVFTEQNGSTAAAEIVSSETGAKIFTLHMAMSGDSYFHAMYQNINAVKEALQ